MAIEPGAVLANAYRLLHTIGEGGMAHVWVAEQIALERRVAIKVLTDEIIQNAAGRELFEREARATARVDHPHVVRVLGFDVTEEGVAFLVLELLVGETLDERLRCGAFELGEVHALVEQTCDALAFAHDCGILHRDIKSSNLFLQRRRARGGPIDVKLLDFGIALHKNRPLAMSVGIAGTPSYMSPEQMRGEEVDERCDLFSLAVCAYQALTLSFPYPGETAEEVSESFATGNFTPVSKTRPDLPPEIDEWFARALAIDRGQRFPSARAMFEELDAIMQPRRNTPLAIDVSAPSAPRKARWQPVVAIAVTFAAIVLAFARVRTPARAVVHREPIVAAVAPAPPPPPTTTMSIEQPPPPPPLPAAPATTAARPTPKPRWRPPAPRAHPDAGIEAPDAAVAEPEPVIEGTEGFGNRW